MVNFLSKIMGSFYMRKCLHIGLLFLFLGTALFFAAKSRPLGWLYSSNGATALPVMKPYSVSNNWTSEAFVHILLSRISKPENVVLAAYVDFAFVDMAISFYETSLRPWNITNFVFATSDEISCERLKTVMRPEEADACFPYHHDAASQKASSFGTDDFVRKMNIRTDMIIDGLEANITVLHSDIDIFFQKNPFSFINCATNCDIAALMDCNDPAYNAGFVYVRPTVYGKWVYREMKSMSIRNPKLNDQEQLIAAVKLLKSTFPDFKPLNLPTKQFMCGRRYFDDEKRRFAGDNPCSECVVVHNNWIISKALKVYRFKEHLMWNNDGDGYYSSESRRYLAYENPVVFSDDSARGKEERTALISALAIGWILHRTVILPAFHCGNSKDSLCALNSVCNLEKFDSVFGDAYREHVFLRHARVPKLFKEGKSVAYLINTTMSISNIIEDQTTILTPGNLSLGVTSDEILAWFGTLLTPVLNFHSLYRSVPLFTDKVNREEFRLKVERAF